MSVSFRQLEVFCAVAEHLSFTRASQILFHFAIDGQPACA
jgi:hypothetical protein